jgi:hypothetical protein
MRTNVRSLSGVAVSESKASATRVSVRSFAVTARKTHGHKGLAGSHQLLRPRRARTPADVLVAFRFSRFTKMFALEGTELTEDK